MEFGRFRPDAQINFPFPLKRFNRIFGAFLATQLLACTPSSFERPVNFEEVCNPDRIGKIGLDPYILIHVTMAEKLLHDEKISVILTRSDGFKEERAKFDPQTSLVKSAAIILEGDIKPETVLVLEVRRDNHTLIASHLVDNINVETGNPCLFPV